MAEMSGGVEVRVDATGRDEETLRRFLNRLAAELPEAVERIGVLSAGVDVQTARGGVVALTVRP